MTVLLGTAADGLDINNPSSLHKAQGQVRQVTALQQQQYQRAVSLETASNDPVLASS